VILPICFTGMETFLVAVVYGLPEHVCAILIGFVVAAATIVTITRSSVVVRITLVIVVTVVAESHLLSTLTF
jgi:hypothetical protein